MELNKEDEECDDLPSIDVNFVNVPDVTMPSASDLAEKRASEAAVDIRIKNILQGQQSGCSPCNNVVTLLQHRQFSSGSEGESQITATLDSLRVSLCQSHHKALSEPLSLLRQMELYLEPDSQALRLVKLCLKALEKGGNCLKVFKKQLFESVRDCLDSKVEIPQSSIEPISLCLLAVSNSGCADTQHRLAEHWSGTDQSLTSLWAADGIRTGASLNADEFSLRMSLLSSKGTDHYDNLRAGARLLRDGMPYSCGEQTSHDLKVGVALAKLKLLFRKQLSKSPRSTSPVL